MDTGAWRGWAMVHGVTETQTGLSNLERARTYRHTRTHTHTETQGLTRIDKDETIFTSNNTEFLHTHKFQLCT